MEQWIKGMDISSLLQVEAGGGRFHDGFTGNMAGRNETLRESVPEEELTVILKRHGMNFARLRLWNDPRSPEGEPYGGGNTDLFCVRTLASRLKERKIPWLLDFHYSDFWADPGKQMIPKAWRGKNFRELEEAVYQYTASVLMDLARDGLQPVMVAPGNELTNGLLHPVGKVPDFEAITRLIGAGIRAVREVLPGAEIMLHLDNGGNNALYRWWFDSWYAAGGADFDVIGLSYYPFWHGTMDALEENLHDLAGRYHKPMLVTETSFAFSTDSYGGYEGLDESRRKGAAASRDMAKTVSYPMTPDGQCRFLQDLMQRIVGIPDGLGRGFVYWEPGLLPVPGTDWALPAGLAYTGEEGPGGNEWANQALFDYEGYALPALKTIEEFCP